jgi:putative ABC transport system permease protein
LAVIAVRAFPAFHAFYIPRLEEVVVDHTILVVAMAVAMGSGILFGLAPASQFGRRNPAAALHPGDAASFVRVAGIRLRNVLVTTQLALAVVLLSGAGLMTNTLIRLLRLDLGFERDHLVVIQTILPFRKYTPVTSAEFVRKLAAEVERLPGVVAASAADHVPLEAVLSPYDLRAAQSGSQNICHALARHIDRKFLTGMGIPLLAGRDFEPADDRRSPIPVLINPVAARALFGTDNPLGRQILTDYRSRPRLEVVGVVGNVRQIGLGTEPGAQIYLPLIYGPARNVAARATVPAAILSPSIQAAVRALDRDAPPPEIGTMDDWFSRHTARPRFYLGLLAAFAGAGLLLAAIGIYGVISYTVERRTREFGIRMALGATPRDVLRLVLGIGARLTLAGAVVGLAGAVAATRLLAALLYGVKPGDPLTLAAVVLLLAGVALAACYLGARKATQADPSATLRCE